MRKRPYLNTPRSPQGFSLIELLVVLAIIGILSFVGITQLDSKSQKATKGALLELTNHLVEARQLARATGQKVTLHISADARIIPEYPDPANPDNILNGTTYSTSCRASSSGRALIGAGMSQLNATGVDLSPIRALPLVASWENLLVNENNLLHGAEDSSVSFAPNGEPSKDFFVTVASTGPEGAMGLTVVTRMSGIHSFSRSSSSEPWRRL